LSTRTIINTHSDNTAILGGAGAGTAIVPCIWRGAAIPCQTVIDAQAIFVTPILGTWTITAVESEVGRETAIPTGTIVFALNAEVSDAVKVSLALAVFKTWLPFAPNFL
jgi:hypothetical protein